MATENFDVFWRVVTAVNDDALQCSVASVQLFDYYGEALAEWRRVDEQESNSGTRLGLVAWYLLDPNGFELLDREHRLYRSDLADSDEGCYLYDEASNRYLLKS